MAALHAGWISPVHRRECLPRRAKLNSDRRSGDQTRHTTVIAGMRDQQQTAERMLSEQQRGEQIRRLAGFFWMLCPRQQSRRSSALGHRRGRRSRRTSSGSSASVPRRATTPAPTASDAGHGGPGGRIAPRPGSSRLGRRLCAARRKSLVRLSTARRTFSSCSSCSLSPATTRAATAAAAPKPSQTTVAAHNTRLDTIVQAPTTAMTALRTRSTDTRSKATASSAIATMATPPPKVCRHRCSGRPLQRASHVKTRETAFDATTTNAVIRPRARLDRYRLLKRAFLSYRNVGLQWTPVACLRFRASGISRNVSHTQGPCQRAT
jgi:hypothetical protein